MKFTARLYKVNEKAQDSSVIPREVMEEYLASERYRKDIANKRMLGGLTHKSRQTSIKGIGPSDGLLTDDNTCFYLTRIYFDGDSCYADAETLDPENFSGLHKDNINTVIGLLRNGCLLPISLVISAEWSPREVCTYIDRMLGLDITLDPSFKSAEIIKVFSKTNSGSIRAFSTEAEIKVYDAASMPIATNTYENVDLHEVCPTCLLEDSEFMKQYKELPHVDKKYLKVFADKYIARKMFTYDVNLRDRMLIANKPIFNQFYLLVKGYGLYFKQHESQVLSSPDKFIRMFMADLSNIVLKGMKKIQSNVSPAAPLGMKGYDISIEEAVENFTNIHFKNGLIFKSSGFLPKNRFEDERDATIRLYNAVLSYITDRKLQLTKSDNIIYI